MPTSVIFRTDKRGDFKGTVTAVFPQHIERDGRAMCYAHVGQHAYCSRGWYLQCTRPATEAEAAPLRRELVAVGYDDLREVKRWR